MIGKTSISNLILAAHKKLVKTVRGKNSLLKARHCACPVYSCCMCVVEMMPNHRNQMLIRTLKDSVISTLYVLVRQNAAQTKSLETN